MPSRAGTAQPHRSVVLIDPLCTRYCVASGERSRAGIPGPVESLPSYDGRLLFAIINMETWPAYAAQQARAATTTTTTTTLDA